MEIKLRCSAICDGGIHSVLCFIFAAVTTMLYQPQVLAALAPLALLATSAIAARVYPSSQRRRRRIRHTLSAAQALASTTSRRPATPATCPSGPAPPTTPCEVSSRGSEGYGTSEWSGMGCSALCDGTIQPWNRIVLCLVFAIVLMLTIMAVTTVDTSGAGSSSCRQDGSRPRDCTLQSREADATALSHRAARGGGCRASGSAFGRPLAAC